MFAIARHIAELSRFKREKLNVLSWYYFIFKFRDAINCLVGVIDVEMFLVLTKIMLYGRDVG